MHDAVKLPVTQAIIDGEVMVTTPEGLSDFAVLQAELANERSDRLTFYAFDLLYADGYDLRRAALLDRKAALAEILKDAPKRRFLYSDHIELDGALVYARACEMGIEGIVSKLRDSPYASGRSDAWRKIVFSRGRLRGCAAQEHRCALSWPPRGGRPPLCRESRNGFHLRHSQEPSRAPRPTRGQEVAAYKGDTETESSLGETGAVRGRRIPLHYTRRETAPRVVQGGTGGFDLASTSSWTLQKFRLRQCA